jgi:CBS domain containing-hemolysin-like protein
MKNVIPLIMVKYANSLICCLFFILIILSYLSIIVIKKTFSLQYSENVLIMILVVILRFEKSCDYRHV